MAGGGRLRGAGGVFGAGGAGRGPCGRGGRPPVETRYRSELLDCRSRCRRSALRVRHHGVYAAGACAVVDRLSFHSQNPGFHLREDADDQAENSTFLSVNARLKSLWRSSHAGARGSMRKCFPDCKRWFMIVDSGGQGPKAHPAEPATKATNHESTGPGTRCFRISRIVQATSATVSRCAKMTNIPYSPREP